MIALIDQLVPDEIIEESITGMLEMLDIHAWKFRIYPIVGPKKIDCYFLDDHLQQKVISGINRYVNVEGEFRYKRFTKFPYAAQVKDIEIYPNEDELPTLSDLHGMALNATWDLSSEDFVRRLRNDEW